MEDDRRSRHRWLRMSSPAYAEIPVRVPARSRPSWPVRVVRSRTFAWVVSIALHAGLFYGFYSIAMREAAPIRRIIIPEAQLTGSPSPQQPIQNVPLKLTQQQSPSIMDRQAAPETPPVAVVSLGEIPTFTVPTDNRPEISGASLPGEAIGLAGSAGPAGSMAPASGLFGQAGNAYKVVYVADFSESVYRFRAEICAEIQNSLETLVPTQKFHIVFAKPGGDITEFGTGRLVPAIRKYKKDALAFLETSKDRPKRGSADPIEAFRRAFRVNPELIYFIADGDYRNIEEELERTLDQLNKNRAVAITTLGFDPAPRCSGLMERIAKNHGGHFRIVPLATR